MKVELLLHRRALGEIIASLAASSSCEEPQVHWKTVGEAHEGSNDWMASGGLDPARYLGIVFAQ